MLTKKNRRLPLALVPLLAACGGSAVYRDEGFGGESPFRHYYEAIAPAQACLAAERTLLGEGYHIVAAAPQAVSAAKAFQPDDDEHATLEFSVRCMPERTGTLVFANAIQTVYGLKSSGSHAGVSVSGVGSLSLPWTTSNEELAKKAQETVSDADFYRRFFKALQEQIR